MRQTTLLAALGLCLAGAALAHTGVKNAAVMARMHGMNAIAAEMKTLGEMAKGAAPFDAAAARAAAASIARHAAETPALFEAEEDDPKSEAKPEIWQDFSDFTAKSTELEKIAGGLAESIQVEADLRPAVAALGGTCQSCHKLYRE